MNDDLEKSSDDWLVNAKFIPGSWWPDWGEWLAQKSGATKTAKLTGSDNFIPICDAPGNYVRMSSKPNKK